MTYAVLRVDPATFQDIKDRLKAVDDKIKPGSTAYQAEYIRPATDHIVFGPVGLEADNVTGRGGDLNNADKIACWDMVEQLRSYEGDDVRILCDNPDGLNAIECNGAWTDYGTLRIEGQNTFSCLATASGMHDAYYHDKNPTLTAPVPKKGK